MSVSSGFFKASSQMIFFRRTPEGQVFRSPSPWIFGRAREYLLTDAQAELLAARLGRAQAMGFISAAVAGVIIAQHPIPGWWAIATFAVLLVSFSIGIFYLTAGTVLSGLSWTSAPREPYSLAGHLKKTFALSMLVPTWISALLFASTLIGLPVSVMHAYSAVASSHVSFGGILELFVNLALLFWFGTTLIVKSKANSAAPRRRRRYGWWIAGGIFATLLALPLGTAVYFAEPIKLVYGFMSGNPSLPGCKTAIGHEATVGALRYRVVNINCADGGKGYFVYVKRSPVPLFQPVLLISGDPIPVSVRQMDDNHFEVVLASPLLDGRASVPFSFDKDGVVEECLSFENGKNVPSTDHRTPSNS